MSGVEPASPAIPVQPGRTAPDFTLANQHGESVTLSALRGRAVVLIFYPFALSRTCTGELRDIRDRIVTFDNDRTVTLAVSCDAVYSLRAFADAEGYSFNLLSDFWPHGEVSRLYGVFVESRGAAKRGTFVIDRDGVVRWSIVHEIGEGRDVTEYLRALKDLDAG
jgi:mycoredoxin-dependent peroxiredoxin